MLNELLGEIKVVSTATDTANYGGGTRVTLERGDGKKFTVNIPNECWGDERPYGLNLVFDHSGEGDHYT